MTNQIRTFERGDQVITIAPAGRGLFDVATDHHTMTLDAHAVQSFIKSGKLTEITK
ncbi:hypothetical protein SAMN05421827_109110 [Pedobacter terrae]|uniref:Uncharacterized protein n=1 Tax=Pedobacter terrae TaxID=405671 RepID=A0A1G7W5R4_9SPHI|nr:hypothetical protein SAMN05421827_109110 [Pedobacter terrae]